jgi:hypothetical protein
MLFVLYVEMRVLGMDVVEAGGVGMVGASGLGEVMGAACREKTGMMIMRMCCLQRQAVD